MCDLLSPDAWPWRRYPRPEQFRVQLECGAVCWAAGISIRRVSRSASAGAQWQGSRENQGGLIDRPEAPETQAVPEGDGISLLNNTQRAAQASLADAAYAVYARTRSSFRVTTCGSEGARACSPGRRNVSVLLHACSAALVRGSSTKKVVPLPANDSTWMRPPWRSTISLQSVRPSPHPSRCTCSAKEVR